MNRRDLIEHLTNNSCYKVRSKGGHAIFRNKVNGKIAPISIHKRSLNPPMVATICRELGIPRP